MKKLMPLAASIVLILVAGMFATAGTLTLFSDTETIGVHDIQAGTLNLQVGSADPCTVHLTYTDIKPGFFKKLHYDIKNIGTLDGKLTVQISAITNNDNGLTEPESAVDTTGGDGEGELGQYLTWNGMFVIGPLAGSRVFGWKLILNTLGGKTSASYDLPAGAPRSTLKVEFELPRGTGNIVQSDSVEFDIIFYLDQA